MAKTDELIPSFVALLIGDVITASARMKSEDGQSNRRDLVRSIFAAIEGLVWLLRENVRETSEATGYLTPLASMALRETTYQVDGKGRLSEQIRYIPLPAIIRLAVGQASLIAPNLSVDFSGSGWSRFNKAIAIRNRATHPKSREDLHITDLDLRAINDGFVWILTTTTEILDRLRIVTAVFNHEMRDLLDRLKNGDSAALALYHAELNRDDAVSV